MQLIASKPTDDAKTSPLRARRAAALAVRALTLEVLTWPKPGLVSHVDDGSHDDMNSATLLASAEALRPYFAELFEAGAADAQMEQLRAIGRSAEESMLIATGGVNTHRGAIFSLGLLCAAAGWLMQNARLIACGALGATVQRCWGDAITFGPRPPQSHGVEASRRYAAGGARAEAAAGFPHIYQVGLPALRAGRAKAPADPNAARVQTCFALIANLQDTNLLHRGGPEGLRFAQKAARHFLAAGGVSQNGWQRRAAEVHREFVARRLSPGGTADLLAASLLVDSLETARAPRRLTIA